MAPQLPLTAPSRSIIHTFHNEEPGSNQLIRRGEANVKVYTIVIPVVLGVVIICGCVYLFIWMKKRKVKIAKERKEARERDMKTWGRDMGEPIKKQGEGDSNVLLAAQGIGMGLAAVGAGNH